MNRQTLERDIAKFLESIRIDSIIHVDFVKKPGDLTLELSSKGIFGPERTLRLSLLSLIQKRYPRKPAKKKASK